MTDVADVMWQGVVEAPSPTNPQRYRYVKFGWSNILGEIVVETGAMYFKGIRFFSARELIALVMDETAKRKILVLLQDCSPEGKARDAVIAFPKQRRIAYRV